MCQRATLQAPLTTSICLNPMNITETSRKDEVITAACELVDQQEAVIRDLTGKKNTLTFLLNARFIIHILF